MKIGVDWKSVSTYICFIETNTEKDKQMTFQKMSFKQALAAKIELEAKADVLSKALNAFPRGPMGLTPDDVKSSPEFQAAKTAYDNAANFLRQFNQIFMQSYKTEYRAYVNAKRIERRNQK